MCTLKVNDSQVINVHNISIPHLQIHTLPQFLNLLLREKKLGKKYKLQSNFPPALVLSQPLFYFQIHRFNFI